jgi:hypothetical protein
MSAGLVSKGHYHTLNDGPAVGRIGPKRDNLWTAPHFTQRLLPTLV